MFKPPRELVVRLDDSGQDYVGIIVDSLSLEESTWVTVDFSLVHSPLLPLGEHRELAFVGGPLAHPLCIEGIVTHRSESKNRRQYEFQLASNTGATTRSSFPSLPVGEDEFPCSLRSEDGPGSFEAPVRALFATGLLLALSPHQDRALLQAWKCRIALTLPGETQPIELSAVISNRFLQGDEILYRLDFFVEEIPDFIAKQERILAFATRRYAELLQRAKGRTERVAAVASEGRIK